MALPRFRRGPRVALAVAALLASIAAGRTIDEWQQGMPVPVPTQALLLEGILGFDRAVELRGDSAVVVVVLYQPEYRSSRDVQAQLMAHGAASRATLWGRPIRWRSLPVEGGGLTRSSLSALAPSAVYVAPMRAIDVRRVIDVATSLHLASYTGLPSYLDYGATVSFGVRASRPRILVNLPAARRAGADFTAQLLQMADINPEPGAAP